MADQTKVFPVLKVLEARPSDDGLHVVQAFRVGNGTDIDFDAPIAIRAADIPQLVAQLISGAALARAERLRLDPGIEESGSRAEICLLIARCYGGAPNADPEKTMICLQVPERDGRFATLPFLFTDEALSQIVNLARLSWEQRAALAERRLFKLN